MFPFDGLPIHAEWRKILRHAWSVRLIALAALLSGLEVAVPIIGYQLPVSTNWLAAINFAIVSAAFVMRFVAQKAFVK